MREWAGGGVGGWVEIDYYYYTADPGATLSNVAKDAAVMVAVTNGGG